MIFEEVLYFYRARLQLTLEEEYLFYNMYVLLLACVLARSTVTLLCSKAPHVLSYINKAYGGKYQDKKSSNLSNKLDQKIQIFPTDLFM